MTLTCAHGTRSKLMHADACKQNELIQRSIYNVSIAHFEKEGKYVVGFIF